MSRGSGRGGASRGKGNSRRHSMSKSERDNRANQLNPNHAEYKGGNHGHSSPSGSSGSGHGPSGSQPSGGSRWRNRMDQKSASRIQSNADKSGADDGFKERAQSAADRNQRDDKN